MSALGRGLFCPIINKRRDNLLGTFLITLRETLEAAIIVGILFTYLNRIGQSRYYSYIYYGVFAAIGASVAFAYFSNIISELFYDGGQEIFEASIMFLAVGVLTYMVVWMHHNAREIKGRLQKKADAAVARKRLWALALLSFVGVFREGVETVLFLWGLFLQAKTREVVDLSIAGGIVGVVSAIFLAWLFFKGFGHLDLRVFFRVTGILLIFIAAGLLASGIGKLQMAGIVPPVVEAVWDTSWLIDERSLIGSLLSGLLGYNANPSLMEILFYLMYFPMVLLLLRKQHHDLAQ